MRVADVRWQIEEGFAQLKGELGLDQYEVRRWEGWHRCMTLCLLAHAYLVMLRLQARLSNAGPAEDILPLTVPELRRLVLALAGTAERRAFRLRWSNWRRKHQATAARSRMRSPGSDRVLSLEVKVTSVAAVPRAGLSDGEWAVVQPLLPPQRPATGRPRHDHRTVLSGIVWVMRRGASWREVPKACGKWETAYKRYQLWCGEGRWQCIARTLGIEDREVAL